MAVVLGAMMAAGVAGPGVQSAAAQPAFPSWLVGFESENPVTGVHRGCTAVEVTGVREVTAPDCFTGRSGNDWYWWYHGGTPDWGGNAMRYATAAGYDATTRKDALAVAPAGNSPVSYMTGNGHPVLATAADAALYAPGAAATFYSWAGRDSESARSAHTEQVAILTTATCASLLGRTPPTGSFCTLPAKGAPAPDPADQCLGDAGGALVAGGKLIGISATPASGCVAADGVRLYTGVAAHRTTVETWRHDVYFEDWETRGSVVATQPSTGGGLVSFCGVNGQDRLVNCEHETGATGFWHVSYDWIVQPGDITGDGNADLLARTPGGGLYRYSGPGPVWDSLDTRPHTWLGNGFAGYNALFAANDFSGDGLPDLLGRDAAGDLWLHTGNGKGGFGPRKHIGVGLKGYNLVTGRGDLSGDGLADFVARDSAGTLWLFKGNGRGSYAGRVKLGTGYAGYRRIVADGDIDGDGRQDLFATTPAGGAAVLNVSKGVLAPAKWYASKGYQYFSHIA
ncbi:FG-GAP repeat domain-containing protein [Streptomyces sp. NPDC001493]